MNFFKTPIGPVAFLAAFLSIVPAARAINPIVQTIYTADPAALVHDGTVYLYTGHDEDGSTWFTMKDWHVYSSKDLVNWIDHGSSLSLKTFDWVKDSAWAGQAIERDGKFYWYVPVEQKTGGMAIGVAVSDSPTGPFKDALGKALVFDGFGDIDPTVFIDDNGQGYLAWGNPTYKYVKLNKDMISYDTSVGDKGIFRGPMTVEAFGKRKTTDRETAYEEAPWIYKRKNLYYLFHAGGPVPENLSYSTGPTAEGPWKYGGIFMSTQGGSFTNHPAVIDFKGKTYLFYHDGGLPGGGGFTRSVCVDEMKFRADGSVEPMNMTREGPAPVAALDPYLRNEAETIAWESGIEVEPGNQGGFVVHDIDAGNYIEVKNVDFGSSGAGIFHALIASESRVHATKPSLIELRLDSVSGSLIGTLPVGYTEGKWKPVTTAVSGATGTHNLFFVFKGEDAGDLFKFDQWQFARKSSSPKISAITVTSTRYKIDSNLGADSQTEVKVTAMYTDGTSKDVTAQAKISSETPEIATFSKGSVSAKTAGVARLKASYENLVDVLTIQVKDMKSESAVVAITADDTSLKLVNGDTQSFKVTARFLDDHKEDVTSGITCTSASPEIAEVKDGMIIAKAKGEADIQISFQDRLGNTQKTSLKVSVADRNPFVENKFEKFSDQKGIVTEKCSEGGQNICDSNNGEWVRFNGLDFGSGAKSVEFRVASANAGGTLEVRLDSPDGVLVGSCKIDNTGGWQKWTTKSCELKYLSGRHDVVFKFTGESGVLFNMNWWKFVK